jgi:hypothetical protein
MFTLVSGDGKAHGFIETEEAARLLIKERKMTGIRLLTEAEWQQVVDNPDDRATLCATLGKAL